jgi:hypothetical protein
MDDSVFDQSPFTTEPTAPSTSQNGSSGKRGKKLLFLIILLVVLGLIAFGAVQLLGGQGEAEPTPTPTESFEIPTDTPAPTEDLDTTPTPEDEDTTTPTPTKKPAVNGTDQSTGLDRADLSIVVQNGSGEAGVAGTMKSKLEGLGYVVSSTGNADNYDYAQTEIHVKSASSDFIPLLKKDLGGTYTIGTSASDYTGSGDALIIVGKE